MTLLQDFPFSATGIVTYQALDDCKKDTSTIKVEKVYKLEPSSSSDIAIFITFITFIFIGICIINAFNR